MSDDDKVEKAADGFDFPPVDSDVTGARAGLQGDACDDLGASDAETSGGDPMTVAACSKFDHSDTDLSQRFRAHFGADFVVMAQEGISGGDWLAWDQTHWEHGGGAATALMTAQRLGGLIALEAAFLSHSPLERQAIQDLADFSGDKDNEDFRKIKAAAEAADKSLNARKLARHRFAVTSKNKGRCESQLAMTAPHLRRSPDDFNVEPRLVATKSHTLNFIVETKSEIDPEGPDPDATRYVEVKRARVEAIAEHRRADYITALVPHNYDPKAKAPKWQAFLDRCLPEPEKRRTVQSFTGAGLLGDSLQRLMFHYGLGANGKSIFLETVTRVLGDSFAIGLPPESIVGGGDRNAGGASPDLARLFGKRMVRVLELPEGKALNEDLIKRLTGGERFPVRTLFKGYFEFENKAKPHMSGNAFPRVDGTDAGIWRRLLVVHWKQTIPVGERREFKDLLGDFLAEGPGILNWLIEGARDFLENGLYVAPEIESATDQWHAESDPIGEFFKDCVVDVPEAENATLTPSEAYAAYVAWSGYNAKHVKTQTKFGSEMVKRYRREQSNGRRYVNCGLRNVPTMASGDPGPSPEAYR